MSKIVPSLTPTTPESTKQNKLTQEIYLEKLEKTLPKYKQCLAVQVFHPESLYRMSWDMSMLILIIYQAITIPYYICFSEDYATSAQNSEIFINAFFFFDILLSCNTGFYEKGSLVLKRWEILKNYFKFWFWIDLLATFPYTWVIEGVYPQQQITQRNTKVYSAPSILRIVRIFRFLRILRLLRLAKLKKMLIKIEDYIASNVIASVFMLIRIVSGSFLTAHWIACIWFYIGGQNEDGHPITWVTKAGIQDSSNYEQYVTSLYWAFTTIATVGYGDITPITMWEKVFAMFTMVVSSAVFAYTLGSIGTLVSKQNALENSYRETFVSVNSYMKRKYLPKDLQFRVRRYLEYLWEKKKKNKIDEKEVLNFLSEPLRDEIFGYINAKVLKVCEVFQQFDENFVIQITRMLEVETYAPGDTIFDEGEKSHKIYFIIGGTILIFHSATQMVYTTLKSKSYFGEISFFLETKRSASSTCKEFSDLLTLSRSDLLFFLEKFPETAQRVNYLVESCKNMDYTQLGIKCYICDELGHIVNQCKNIILNIDQGEVRKKWIENKEIRKTVRINTRSFPRYVRNYRKVEMAKTIRNSVLGATLKESVKDRGLVRAIQKAEKTLWGLGGDSEKYPLSSPVSPEMTELRPNFSLLCNSETEEEVVERTPKPMFGLRLHGFSTTATPFKDNIKEEEDENIGV